MLAVIVAAGLASCGERDVPAGEAACRLKPTQTFNERIAPLLTSDHQSTCNQCHLSGVDLSTFARATPCETWVCLVEQGFVDTAAPEESKILAWIARAKPDSVLITPEVLAAEHDAFRDWIDAHAACPSACADVTCGPTDAPTCGDGLVEAEQLQRAALEASDLSGAGAGGAGAGGAGLGGADSSLAVPEDSGCSDRELEQAFADDVYLWRGRCSPCHFDSHPNADPAAPRWISTVGNCNNGSAITFKNARDLGILDADDPLQSLILLKPLDLSGGGVAHGGGDKFSGKDDPTYLSFLQFLELYQRCQARK
jgi:hypothetical protein